MVRDQGFAVYQVSSKKVFQSIYLACNLPRISVFVITNLCFYLQGRGLKLQSGKVYVAIGKKDTGLGKAKLVTTLLCCTSHTCHWKLLLKLRNTLGVHELGSQPLQVKVHLRSLNANLAYDRNSFSIMKNFLLLNSLLSVISCLKADCSFANFASLRLSTYTVLKGHTFACCPCQRLVGVCCGQVGELVIDVAAAGSDRARTSEP